MIVEGVRAGGDAFGRQRSGKHVNGTVFVHKAVLKRKEQV
jgi:hypothetical protein